MVWSCPYSRYLSSRFSNVNSWPVLFYLYPHWLSYSQCPRSYFPPIFKISIWLINCNLLIHLIYFEHFCQPEIYIKFSWLCGICQYTITFTYSWQFFVMNIFAHESFEVDLRTCPRHEITKSEVGYFFFFFKFLFYLFMAMLGLRFCARAFSSCGKWGPLFIAARGPLTIAASLVTEHRLQTRRLSNRGSRA